MIFFIFILKSEKKTISSKYSGVTTIKKNIFQGADTQSTQLTSVSTQKTKEPSEKTKKKSGKYNFQDKEQISNFDESPNKTRKKIDEKKQ